MKSLEITNCHLSSKRIYLKTKIQFTALNRKNSIRMAKIVRGISKSSLSWSIIQYHLLAQLHSLLEQKLFFLLIVMWTLITIILSLDKWHTVKNVLNKITRFWLVDSNTTLIELHYSFKTYELYSKSCDFLY